MHSEKLLILLAKSLHSKACDLEADRSEKNPAFHHAEMGICRDLVREITATLDRIEAKNPPVRRHNREIP